MYFLLNRLKALLNVMVKQLLLGYFLFDRQLSVLPPPRGM